jgi:RNA polymerase-binding transcription factor DksA
MGLILLTRFTVDTFNNSMAPQFLKLLRQREAQLRELLGADHPALYSGVGEAAHEVDDFKDVASLEAQGLVAQAQSDHATLELQRVREACARLAKGNYGTCLACSEPIDLRRLLALPAVPLCAVCQLREEVLAYPAVIH